MESTAQRDWEGDFCNAQVMRDKGPSGKQLSLWSLIYRQIFTLCRQRGREGIKGMAFCPGTSSGSPASSTQWEHRCTAHSHCISSSPVPPPSQGKCPVPWPKYNHNTSGCQFHVLLEDKVSKGMLRVDLQLSSRGGAGWTEGGNQLTTSQNTAQGLDCHLGHWEEKGPGCPCSPGQQGVQAAVTALCWAQEQQAGPGQMC